MLEKKTLRLKDQPQSVRPEIKNKTQGSENSQFQPFGSLWRPLGQRPKKTWTPKYTPKPIPKEGLLPRPIWPKPPGLRPPQPTQPTPKPKPPRPRRPRKIHWTVQRRLNKLKRIQLSKEVVLYGSKGKFKLTKKTIDYKNVNLLKSFITRQGKIVSRRQNFLSTKQQRKVTIAIKTARVAGLLPFLGH